MFFLHGRGEDVDTHAVQSCQGGNAIHQHAADDRRNRNCQEGNRASDPNEPDDLQWGSVPVTREMAANQ